MDEMDYLIDDEREMKTADFKRGDKCMVEMEVGDPHVSGNGKVLVVTNRRDYIWVPADSINPLNDKYKQALINLAKAKLEHQQAKTIDERESAIAVLMGRAMTEALSMGMELLEDVKNV